MEKTQTNNLIQQKPRVNWVDCLKFIAIFFIYIGHQPKIAGNFYLFAFSFHVPLFFMIAGFFANKKDIPLLKFIIKNTKRLLIPFVSFTIIVTLFAGLLHNHTIFSIIRNTINNLAGVRNHLTSGDGLWFIICLFWIVIFYEILRRLLSKIKWHEYIILILSLISLLIIDKFGNAPSIIFNIDSAFYYIFYYSLGVIIYPLVNKIITSLKESESSNNSYKTITELLIIGLFFVSSVTTALVFFGYPITSIINSGYILNLFFTIIQTILLCIFFIFISFIFQNIKLFCEIGRNTLVLCCLEYIINYYYILVASNLGLWQNNMVVACMNIFLMLVVAHFTFVKFINTHFPVICGKSKVQKENINQQKNQG